MDYKEYKPSPALEPYVKCYYTLVTEDGAILEDNAYATGCMEVMFSLHGAAWQTKVNGTAADTPAVGLWGQVVKPLAFRVSGRSEVFGIRFLPSSPAFLLKEDISRFNDSVVDLTSVLGHSVRDLHIKLQEADSVFRQVALADTFLTSKLVGQPKVAGTIDLVGLVMKELAHKDFFDNIDNVASRYGITSRYLQKIFVQHTGLTPKLYSRINRFQNSLVLMGEGSQSLTAVAYACGYFDQSHFIREFKAFTGGPPSGFDTDHSTAIQASPNK